ncbi:NUDIX hydrolase [Sneathiella chinensis]|uniref:DNA mismatch repair protein MutT n=1 Tax=Sneathiella chinensis TaxID=349750 RepID=A0ABQ5U903_9PROT|nr:NUDIX hydrolase [Sneathiella chinensis]GLQ07668.1 DNA mismatch repair protein MutT [Sneathiella chinensis]
MSDNKKRTIAENRVDGSKAPRPKDAASIIIYRQQGPRTEILMGERSGKHSFMPNTYVFPGGRVDPADSRVKPARDLRDDVLMRLCRGGCSPARARALAMAAIRETFEETGLLLSASFDRPYRSKVSVWNDFGTQTCGPDLSRLDYIARAVTPPMRKKRFNTRFFVADGTDITGRLDGSGELLDMKWVTLDEALDLNIPQITEYILKQVGDYLKARPAPSPERPVQLFKMVGGKRIFTTE